VKTAIYSERYGRLAKEPEMMFVLLFLKKLHDLSDERLISSAQADMTYKYLLDLAPKDKMVETQACRRSSERCESQKTFWRTCYPRIIQFFAMMSSFLYLCITILRAPLKKCVVITDISKVISRFSEMSNTSERPK